MNKALSIIVLVVSLFLITVLCTGVNLLLHDFPIEQLDFDKFVKGHVHLIFFTQHFRAMYPDLQPSGTFIFIPAMLFASAITLVIYYFLSYREKCRAVYVGLACMVSGLIPYFTGMWILRDNTSLDYCGWWIAVMLLGMLYCCIAGMMFMVLDIFNVDIAKFNPRVSLRRPYFNWGSEISHQIT